MTGDFAPDFFMWNHQSLLLSPFNSLLVEIIDLMTLPIRYSLEEFFKTIEGALQSYSMHPFFNVLLLKPSM